MTKRALSLLFTLFFLLLGTTTAWGQYANDVVVAGTDFNSKTGNYPCSLNDIIYFGEESLSTSFTQASGSNPGEGKYTITADGMLVGKKSSSQNNPNVFAHSIQGLLTVSGHNDYKVVIYMKATGQVQLQLKTTVNGNDNYAQFQIENQTTTKTINFTTTSGSYSYALQRQGGDGTLLITRIEVIGDTEPKITSSLGFGVCAGETTTLQVIGHSGAIQWQVSENPSGPWTNVQGATSAKLDVQVTKNQYYKVGNIVSRRLTPTMCCAYESNPNYISEVRFIMSGTQPENLPAGATIDQTPGTGYKYYTADDPNKIQDGEYAVVHRTIDGGYWNDAGFVSNIVGKDYATNRSDGFLLVNCNPANSGKPMYEQIVTGLCPGAMHNFSISVVSVDVRPDHEGIAVKMQVYAMNGNTVGEALLTDPITIRKGCGEGWGEPYSASITTPSGCTSVKISIINANTSGNNAGNDVGIDDILFSRCNPEIALFANEDRSLMELEYCPNTDAAKLYVGEPANLDILFPAGKWYYYQEKTATGTWSSLGAPVQDNTFAVSPTAATTYRVTVAGTSELAKAAGDGTLGSSLGCNSFATSNEVTITPQCDCTASPAPQTDDYAACPSTTKLDLNTLITNRSTSGTYYWYTSATGDTQMSATDAQNVDVSTYNSASPTTTYYVSYDQDGTSDTYCESERTPVKVTLYDQAPGLKAETIANPFATYCRNELPKPAGLAITTQDQFGNPTPDPTMVYTWSVIDDDGNEVTALGTTGDEEFIMFSVPADSPTNFRMRVISSSPTLCPKTDEFIYAVIHENTNFTLSAPTDVCLAAPAVTLTLTNMSGTGDLVIKKGTTTLKTETNFSGTEYTYTDNGPHGNVDAVTYTVTFGDPNNCGKTATATVNIGSNMDVPLTSNATNNTVCEGTKVTITANRPVNNSSSETYKWYKNGTEITGVTGPVFSDPEALTENTTYKAEVTNGACDGEGTITITVDKKPHVILTITRDNICHGDTSTVQIDYSKADVVIPTGSTFKWNATYSNGVNAPSEYDDFNTTSPTGLKQHVFEAAGNYGFTLTAYNGTCEHKSAPVDFWVAGAPQFSVSATESTICQDNPTTLLITMPSNKAAEVTSKKWTLNGAEVTGNTSESVEGTNTIFGTEISPTLTGKLTYQAEVVALCSATKTVEITVEEGIIASIQDFEICDGEDVKLELDANGDYTYKWSPNNGLSDNTIQQPTASPSQDITYSVFIETKLKTCSATKETKVTVHPKPVIVSIEETDVRQITAVADDQTQWPTFRVDDIDNTYENSPVVISGIPIGYHRLYITNEWGCENSETFEISPIPVIPKKFFSPNGEGDPETEYWTVEGLDAYTSWIVEIFDRYGRRVYEYRTGSFSETGNDPTAWKGWDGNYNGHQMPSDDYWYLITVEEIRKQYSGHFTLKR
jgi:gliding motility-associated-like protein